MSLPLSIIAASEPSSIPASRGFSLLDPALMSASEPASLSSAAHVDSPVLQDQHSKTHESSPDSPPALPPQVTDFYTTSGDHERSTTCMPVPVGEPLLNPAKLAGLATLPAQTWAGDRAVRGMWLDSESSVDAASNSSFAPSPQGIDFPGARLAVPAPLPLFATGPGPYSAGFGQTNLPPSQNHYYRSLDIFSMPPPLSYGSESRAFPDFPFYDDENLLMQRRIEHLEAQLRLSQDRCSMSHRQHVSDLNELTQVKSLLNRVLRDTLEVVKHQDDRHACAHAIFVAGCNANLAQMYLDGVPAPSGQGMRTVDRDNPAMGHTSESDEDSVSSRQSESSAASWMTSPASSRMMIYESDHLYPQVPLTGNSGWYPHQHSCPIPQPYHLAASSASMASSQPSTSSFLMPSLDCHSARGNPSSTTTAFSSRFAPPHFPPSLYPHQGSGQRFDSRFAPAGPWSGPSSSLPRAPLPRREQLNQATLPPRATHFAGNHLGLSFEHRDSPQYTRFKPSMMSASGSSSVLANGCTSFPYGEVEAPAEDFGRLSASLSGPIRASDTSTLSQPSTNNILGRTASYEDMLDFLEGNAFNKRRRGSTAGYDEEFSDSELTGTSENFHLLTGGKRVRESEADSSPMAKHIKLESMSP